MCWHKEYEVESGRMVLNKVIVMLLEMRMVGCRFSMVVACWREESLMESESMVASI